MCPSLSAARVPLFVGVGCSELEVTLSDGHIEELNTNMNAELNTLDSTRNDNPIKVSIKTAAHARQREAENGITQDLVRGLFDYREGDDPSLPLVWRERPKCGPAPKHKDELKVHPGSYRKIKIARKFYRVHRLVWIWHHGEVPEGMGLDHINRDKWDNRISNLRAVPKSLNERNKVLTKMKGKEQSSKFLGICWDKQRRKWLVSIQDCSGRQHHIGRFDSERKAAAAFDFVIICIFQAAGLPEFSMTNYSQGLLSFRDDVLSIQESDISPAFLRKLEAGEIALPTDGLSA